MTSVQTGNPSPYPGATASASLVVASVAGRDWFSVVQPCSSLHHATSDLCIDVAVVQVLYRLHFLPLLCVSKPISTSLVFAAMGAVHIIIVISFSNKYACTFVGTMLEYSEHSRAAQVHPGSKLVQHCRELQGLSMSKVHWHKALLHVPHPCQSHRNHFTMAPPISFNGRYVTQASVQISHSWSSIQQGL